jgi:DNA-binding NarL/FixJ family response regulator
VLKHPWDIVVLDISSPDGEGLDLLRELRRQHPDARILVFGDRQERWCAARSMSLGARGFVPKTATLSEVRKAVRSVLAGETYFSRSLSSKGPRSSPDSRLDEDFRRKPLSGREKEILVGLSSGKSASEVAAELGINIKTISTYKRRMLDKLHLGSTVALIRYAIDNGIC